MLYKGIYQLFYKEASSRDDASMYHLRNMLNRRDVTGADKVTVNFRSHFNFVQDIMEGCILAQFLDNHQMDFESNPSSMPVFSLMTTDQQYQWLMDEAQRVMENLEITDTSHLDKLRSRMEALDEDDAKLMAMHDDSVYTCAMCGKTYKRRGRFITHLKTSHEWEFTEKSGSKPTFDSPLPSFLRMALLIHDTYDAYRMGDGNRAMRNAKLEMLYAGPSHHTKYQLWLWRMLAYDMALLTPREAFEYRWNMTVNLEGGEGKNIPNDNSVEIQVHKLKSQLMTQGANKSFQSAKVIAMTTQTIDLLKSTVMKASSTVRSSRARSTVDKSKDIQVIAKCLMSQSKISTISWKTFSKFRDPLNCQDADKLHQWIQQQKRIASKLM